MLTFLKLSKGLERRNVVIDQHRTSLRLEPLMWTALQEAAAREHYSVSELCALINRSKSDQVSLTTAVRTFLVSYYRQLAREFEESRLPAGALLEARSATPSDGEPLGQQQRPR